MERANNKLSVFFICVLLVGGTVLPYWQVGKHEFLNYDDGEYITENNFVQGGLSRQSVCWSFTSTVSNHWHPLTWLSHMLDCELFGLNPAGHHLMNLLLHIINTVLLFWVLRGATGAIWQSGFVAALFAVHPLHVESVAWAAERKDTLSTCFWILTMAAYFWYCRRGGLGRYLLALVIFGLGLMAKPMLVTLPVVLLLLDFWPLQRIRFGRLDTAGNRQRTGVLRPSAKSRRAVDIFIEKIPFFGLAVASSVVTIIVMRRAGHVAQVAELSFGWRIASSLVSYAGYILKMFWPNRLAPFYPHPGTTLAVWKAVAAGVFLLFLSVVCIYYVRRRYLLAGWLWYLVTLLPVIGLLQVGSQAMADRYSYVPLIGLFIIVAFAATDIVGELRRGKIALLVSSAVVVLALMVCTYIQVGHWRNSITLFEHTLRVTEDNYVAHNNLANALGEKEKYDAAIEHGLEAVRINPRYDRPHYNLGMAFYHKGDIDKAVSHWRRALQLNPKHSDVHYNLAVVVLKQNEVGRAIEHLQEELKLNPNHTRAHQLLQTLLKDAK